MSRIRGKTKEELRKAAEAWLVDGEVPLTPCARCGRIVLAGVCCVPKTQTIHDGHKVQDQKDEEA